MNLGISIFPSCVPKLSACAPAETVSTGILRSLPFLPAQTWRNWKTQGTSTLISPLVPLSYGLSMVWGRQQGTPPSCKLCPLALEGRGDYNAVLCTFPPPEPLPPPYHLREVQVTILNDSRCQELFRVPSLHHLITKDVFCAGAEDGSADTCSVSMPVSLRKPPSPSHWQVCHQPAFASSVRNHL